MKEKEDLKNKIDKLEHEIHGYHHHTYDEDYH